MTWIAPASKPPRPAPAAAVHPSTIPALAADPADWPRSPRQLDEGEQHEVPHTPAVTYLPRGRRLPHVEIQIRTSILPVDSLAHGQLSARARGTSSAHGTAGTRRAT